MEEEIEYGEDGTPYAVKHMVYYEMGRMVGLTDPDADADADYRIV